MWARRAQLSANSSSVVLSGFRACEETAKVEMTAVSLKIDVDAVRQALFCLMKQDAEEDEEHCGGQDTPLLDAVGNSEAA